MIEKALSGSKQYWAWVGFLMILIGFGVSNYLHQLEDGLAVTGMSRDITWGFYISQFTFFVGVAASAVMLVLPYYLHNYKAFGKIIILGESLAVAAVTICILFIVVDLGQPQRILNVMLHPTPNSMLFWDMIVLNGYLFLNLIIGWASQTAERNNVAPPKWVKILIYVSVPWAVSIHTVTAFLYAGLPGRHLWLTAILAPRFLASAFAAGPAFLLLMVFVVRHLANFDPGKEAIQTLAKIVLYGMLANLFFYGLEFFTAYYSNIPSHHHTLDYLFFGHGEFNSMVPYMWASMILGFFGVGLLINPAMRQKELVLVVSMISIFISTWIDKGMGLVIGGFIPNPLEHYTEYHLTFTELGVALGVWSVGALVLTLLFKIAITVKKEADS
jgi:Ni/Fe-hydrogenase subunit HybB-like protein